ncbi:helix-turn-helix transcriptional regulator [Streptomyces yunnanensis]|uniref:DNA-binding response regulator, NarL/FixJ family, contains REC and HTH domains n=1 Tax=Streptomyces yunnanensis TaxID=156453 RepID=A0A9X8R0B6_9ACTN|nr:LuxR C-terminal-related transcriptional regulator [Streptomyces yunnanensis]SHN32336.1 DNA-binding response regulator, NarL/FixJ family, contains REC and HTH domains [Streptomyces yunnanensis]
MPRVPVQLHCPDPVLEAGLRSQLRPQPGIQLLPPGDPTPPTVALISVDTLDGDTTALLHRIRHTTPARLALLVARLDVTHLPTAAECGITAILRRSQATPEQLTHMITSAARGDGMLPDDLLGPLLTQVGHLQRQVLTPHGLDFSGLTTREIDVLHHVADGRTTTEIAQTLGYSERTVKTTLHGIVTRWHLRNRTHAVAHAIRHGLI